MKKYNTVEVAVCSLQKHDTVLFKDKLFEVTSNETDSQGISTVRYKSHGEFGLIQDFKGQIKISKVIGISKL